jgi:glyoxylate/hydroxypyruvate reductase
MHSIKKKTRNDEVLNMEFKNILVTGRIKELEILRTIFPMIHFDYKSTKDPLEQAYDGYIGFELHPDLDFHKLKWIHVLMAGVDSLVQQTYPSHLVMTRTIGDLPEKIAHYCFMAILMSRYNMMKIIDNNNRKTWDRSIKRKENRNVLIFGTGQIGSEIARLLSEHGYSCYGVSHSGRAKDPFIKVSTNSEDFKNYDMGWVINALPLTAETENYFNESLFSHFNQVQFINIGRGKSVVEEDLMKAIDRGQLSFCYLDVTREEPLDQGSKLWDYDEVLISPHIAALTTPEGSVNCVIDTLKRILKDEALENQVDFSRQY